MPDDKLRNISESPTVFEHIATPSDPIILSFPSTHPTEAASDLAEEDPLTMNQDTSVPVNQSTSLLADPVAHGLRRATDSSMNTNALVGSTVWDDISIQMARLKIGTIITTTRRNFLFIPDRSVDNQATTWPAEFGPGPSSSTMEIYETGADLQLGDSPSDLPLSLQQDPNQPFDVVASSQDTSVADDPSAIEAQDESQASPIELPSSTPSRTPSSLSNYSTSLVTPDAPESHPHSNLFSGSEEDGSPSTEETACASVPVVNDQLTANAPCSSQNPPLISTVDTVPTMEPESTSNLLSTTEEP
ncbi:hypothetical protein FRC03_004170, partial [Tulasnella sp. 419]